MVRQNQKKAILLLIPAVIIIWSLIAIRVKGVLGSSSQVSSKPKSTEAGFQKELILDLDLSYPEPFLIREAKTIKRPSTKQIESSTKKVTNNRPKTIPVSKEIKQEKPWPQIRYKGLIANLSNGGISAVLECNKQVEIVKAGDSWNGFKVNDCWPDSVLLQYDGNEKWLKKN